MSSAVEEAIKKREDARKKAARPKRINVTSKPTETKVKTEVKSES